MHILIVDDEPDNREYLAAHFRLNSTAIVTMADSGEDALYKYHTLKQAGSAPDVVVTDIAMPDMSGLAVAKRLRDEGETVPIVFFTAYDRALNRHGAEDVGAAAYLVKPMLGEELEREIRRVVDEDRTAGNNP